MMFELQMKARKIKVYPAHKIGETAHQITYEWGDSRRTINTGKKMANRESPPHGAGSFHDPQQHFELLDRVENLLRSS